MNYESILAPSADLSASAQTWPDLHVHKFISAKLLLTYLQRFPHYICIPAIFHISLCRVSYLKSHSMYIQSLLSAQLIPLKRCLPQQTLATCKCKDSMNSLLQCLSRRWLRAIKVTWPNFPKINRSSVFLLAAPNKAEELDTLVLVVCTHPCANLPCS